MSESVVCWNIPCPNKCISLLYLEIVNKLPKAAAKYFNVIYCYGFINQATWNFQTCFREAAALNLGPVTGWNLQICSLSQSLLTNIGTFLWRGHGCRLICLYFIITLMKIIFAAERTPLHSSLQLWWLSFEWYIAMLTFRLDAAIAR